MMVEFTEVRTGEAIGLVYSTQFGCGISVRNLALITQFQPQTSSLRMEVRGPDLYELTKNNTSWEGEGD